jgi:hypothetical protein
MSAISVETEMSLNFEPLLQVYPFRQAGDSNPPTPKHITCGLLDLTFNVTPSAVYPADLWSILGKEKNDVLLMGTVKAEENLRSR